MTALPGVQKGFFMTVVATGRRAPPSAAGHRVRADRGNNSASQNFLVVATQEDSSLLLSATKGFFTTAVITGRRAPTSTAGHRVRPNKGKNGHLKFPLLSPQEDSSPLLSGTKGLFTTVVATGRRAPPSAAGHRARPDRVKIVHLKIPLLSPQENSSLQLSATKGYYLLLLSPQAAGHRPAQPGNRCDQRGEKIGHFKIPLLPPQEDSSLLLSATRGSFTTAVAAGRRAPPSTDGNRGTTR